jgi:arylsulfatase A-like enzyme
MKAPTRPNILFFLADDQGTWAMRCAGNPEIHTPNLDRLAQSGIRFENFFCSSPVCSPARASILTGRIPSQHGIHDWLRGGNSLIENELGSHPQLIEYLSGQPGYTDFLAQDGYTCGLSGKWHLGDSHHPQKGFTFWQPHALGGGPYFNAPVIRNGQVVYEPTYITDFITNNALVFLENHPGDGSPFCLNVHYTAPHSPWEREHHPARLYDEYFNHCEFASIPIEPMHPWQINSAPYGYTQDSRRPLLSGYFAAVTAMDLGIGRILDWLETHNLRKNTLIIFSSDNGMNMGHHGIFGKGNGTFPFNMFETSVKVPMIISQPGSLPQGVVNYDLLSHYDLFPTLLEYTGVSSNETRFHTVPVHLPGKSFVPLLRGEPYPSQESIVVFEEYGPTRMIRTREWKYIHRYPYGPHELYDLINDPIERHNLGSDPAYQPKIQELKAGLEEWFFRYSQPALDGRQEPVTGKGQLTRAGLSAKGKKAFADDWHYVQKAEK